MNRNPPRSPPRPGFPASPCVDVCTLDDEQVCIGCRRTIREIIDWSRMSAPEQWRIVRALPARRPRGSDAS